MTLFTEPAQVEALYPEADGGLRAPRRADGRAHRRGGRHFYSCALCQSYAPNHICIITPERLGLCGAYNWLDGKAAYEINPHGGNQPVQARATSIDPVLGQWKGVNDFVRTALERRLRALLGLLDDRRTR